jgi:hypothetical protein
MANTKVQWEAADFKWDEAPLDQEQKGVPPYTWDDVTFLEDILGQSASGDEIAWSLEQLDSEKKRRFIKLVCKVKGIETYSGQKTIRDDIEISAEDCELVIKEVLGIDLTVENIHV